jgi:hypothetical protein
MKKHLIPSINYTSHLADHDGISSVLPLAAFGKDGPLRPSRRGRSAYENFPYSADWYYWGFGVLQNLAILGNYSDDLYR